jgi:hypothetical protein
MKNALGITEKSAQQRGKPIVETDKSAQQN